MEQYSLNSKRRLAKNHKLIWQQYSKPPEPSFTEAIIMKTLDSLGINYYREVIFSGLYTRKTYYRFDFFIPKYTLLIEYDGKHHEKDNMKINDSIKNSFAHSNGLRLYRFNKDNYQTISKDVENLILRIKQESETKAKYTLRD